MGIPKEDSSEADLVVLSATCRDIGEVMLVVVDLDAFIHAGPDDVVAIYVADGEDQRLTTVCKSNMSEFKVCE